MLQGSEAEDADTLFEGKGTKNNRDFQISRKIFQSVIGKISVLLFILSTQSLGNFQRLSDLLYQSLETYAVISQICKFFLNEFIRLGCNGSTLEEHAVNFLAKMISSPSTRRRHCQINSTAKGAFTGRTSIICDHVNWVASCDTICSFGIF